MNGPLTLCLVLAKPYVLNLPCPPDVQALIAQNLPCSVVQLYGWPRLTFSSPAEVELARHQREELLYTPPRIAITDLIGRPVPARSPLSAQSTRYTMTSTHTLPTPTVLPVCSADTWPELAERPMLRYLGAVPEGDAAARWSGYDLPLGGTLTVREAELTSPKFLGVLFKVQPVILPGHLLTLACKTPEVRAWARERLSELRDASPRDSLAEGTEVTHCDDCGALFAADEAVVEDLGEFYCAKCGAQHAHDAAAERDLARKLEGLLRRHAARWGQGRKLRALFGPDGDWVQSHVHEIAVRLEEAELYGVDGHVTGQAADD